MCGIVGFTGVTSLELLTKMADSIYHRGPEESGFFCGDPVALGMRRLSIVDISGGSQPYYSESKQVVVVFNGEIYDHQGHRKQLESLGHKFESSHCDGEIVVHAYEEYGDSWVERVNGMFAIALWDKERNRLLLYRDRIGKKPLYYSHVNGHMIFASEIKAILLHPDVSHELDYVSLGNYFSLKNTSAPRTAYKDVKQLMPGSYLTWDKGQITHSTYWKPDLSPRDGISINEASEEILRLLEDSVRIRTQCDVPFGAFLSGGVDSTAVVALLSRFGSHAGRIKTFSLGYVDQDGPQFASKNQDMIYARRMSKELDTEHHEFIIDHKVFSEALPSILGAFDEPFSGTVSTYFLAEEISKHVKVALSGDGADELFASYLPQRLSFPIERAKGYYAQGKTAYSELSSSEVASLRPYDSEVGYQQVLKLSGMHLSEWRDQINVFSYSEKQNLLNRNLFSGESIANPYEALFLATKADGLLSRNIEIDLIELLPNQILPFVDRLSMAHSLEVRSPFLDYRLVDYVNALPAEYKIFNGDTKHILKKSLEKILPSDLLNRPKEGFVQPIYSWMHGDLKAWTVEYLEQLPKRFFNEEYLKGLIAGYKSGDRTQNAKIWNLVCFSIWLNSRGNYE